MSSLTSFDVLHEHPPQPEDQPENVLSKLFQRVKSTLSTTNTPPPPPSISPTLSGSAITSTTADVNGSKNNANSFSSHPVVSITSPDSQISRSTQENTIPLSSNSTVVSSYQSQSDTNSWIHASDSNGSGSFDVRRDSDSSNNSGVQQGGLFPMTPDDKDRTIVARRRYNATNAPKRASSLFKVSTIDRSIVHDDDSASLASLAPPVVSLSPVFGDQQYLSNESAGDIPGSSINKYYDNRHIDHTRLNTDSSATRDYIHHTLGAREPSGDSDTRSIKSFSSGHQKGNSLTKIIRRVRGEGGVNKDYWMADENAKECFGCSASFFVFRRKHHCRICGFGTSHHEATPLEGIRKFFHAGSNLFLARSRSNTNAGEHIDGSPMPFRRSLAIEDGNLHDSILDPEIAPFIGNEDDDYDDDQDELWPSSSPNAAIGYIALDSNFENEYSSYDDFQDFGTKDKLALRQPRTEEIRDMFTKDRSPLNRRISVTGNRPIRTHSLSLKTRGLLRSDGSDSARSPLDIRPASPYLASNSQMLLHTRHSRAASMVTSTVELNNASLQHMKRLISQLLTRFEISGSDIWEEVIMKLVLKVSNSIQVLGGMDVMEVVKIKKIPGGSAQDSLYINGVVFTKNLAHKLMSRHLSNPRILILRFALEYQRVENHFMSLEPIVNQEKEYLHHLVTRIVALSPQIIVVEKTVSRLALEMLLKHNVAVAYNVKPEVAEAIAHSTGADMILSFDKLGKDPRLGTCGSFEVKTFVHELIPNKRKSFMFFQDCPGNLFCSLVLRGGSLDSLNRIKKVVRLMVWVSYNLKLETSLMSDQFAMTSAVRESKLIEDEKVETSSDPDISRLQESLVPYKKTILSASPFVRFQPPYILARLIEDAVKLKEIEKTATPSQLRDIGNAKILFVPSNTNAIIGKSAGRSQDSNFVEGSYIDISNDFDSKSKAWEDFLSSNIGPPHIVPFAYQNLPFLFSNVCIPTKTVCVGPVIRLIQYYAVETDVTIGHFLDQICWESNFICPTSPCDRPLRDHQRIYAHGDAKVTVSVEPWDSPTTLKKDSIMMWSKCKVCNVETPQVYISDDAKNYSIGKFLELIFYQTNLTCRANICPHDINHNHIRYFGLDAQVVKIERIPIQLYDIHFPPMLVRCKPEYYARTKSLDLDIVRSLITKYWDSVMERIKNCIFDVVHPSKIEAAKQELLEMSRNVVVEKKWILQQLQQTYLNSAPTDTLAMNIVRIKLYEKAVAWDKTFDDFAREYFNPDRDFRRSTASQIRRLFDEKEFPVASDRAHHASLMNDLPMTLDSCDSIETHREDCADPPTDLPFLGSSPTLRVTRTKIEQGDVAALESDIETASSQIAFPFMEPKVTRRLSMNLMQEFRPKLHQTQTSDSIITVTDEDQADKEKQKGLATAPIVPRIPLPPSRATTRVTSRLSMVSLPTFDPMTLIQQEKKENQQLRNNIFNSPVNSTNASPMSARNFGDRSSLIPLDRTPSNEKPNSASSTSSGKNPFFYNKPRARRPTETPPFYTGQSQAATNTSTSDRSSNLPSSTSTNFNNRRSLYLARAQGGAIPTSTSNHSTFSDSQKSYVGSRTRSLTQPMPGSNANNTRARYHNGLNRNPRPLEIKQPIIEVFSSVKEAAKEESDDDDDFQSEGEGDEPYQPSKGYTFSLIQTDAMDEALGSEDLQAMEAANNLRNNNGSGPNGGSGSNEEGNPLDSAMMMFLGEDDYTVDQHSSSPSDSSHRGNSITGTTTVGSPPSRNMTVSGTFSAALAVAKLAQLSDGGDGLELREDEPSSIIALALSSPQYVDKLKGIFRGDGVDTDIDSNSTAPVSNSGTAPSADDNASGSPESNGGSMPSTEGIYDDIKVFDDSLLLEPGTHMKVPFVDGNTMLYCRIFYMEQFHALRKAAGCEYSYIQSLARCMKWDASGGKSGSSFLKTRDDRFIMKQLSKVELEAFTKFAPHYFRYMQMAIYHKRPTVLAKIFGFYRVGYKHGALGRSMNMDVLIMENLFYDRKNLQIFDLKGSRRNRYVQPTGKDNEVLWDENFIQFMSESPFFIREHAKLQLSNSLANDSHFLQSFNIMDYSLLVAVADNQQEIVVGIVDFIRPFTWDKKLESWVKDAVGSKEPTIVSPAQYRKRFRQAMNRHLDMVPDRWFNIEAYFPKEVLHRSIGRSHLQFLHDTAAIELQTEPQSEKDPEQRKGQMQLHQHQDGSPGHQSRNPSFHNHSRYSTGVQTIDESMTSRPPSSLVLSRIPSNNGAD
ncbi:1-phosphatidylinositol-3-phosphate 5-kinase [Entomortierella beljakovae]|nr:1-phosphatidylinositol-3-phosphate 5-kinase [Entomortierella beljakovae]